MRHLDLATVWIKRKYDKDAPAECILAWDGFSIEENWEGWRDACDAALKSIGDDLWQYRFFNLRIKESDIEDQFKEFNEATVLGMSELDDPRNI